MMAALRIPPPPPLRLRPSSIIQNRNPYSHYCVRNTAAISAAAAAKYAVLGAGFAGLAVAWHLLKHCPKESHISIDVYDEVGIGGGASGASGGLLHPYSPKAKVLWRGAECWKECLELLTVAENAAQTKIPENIAHDSSCGSEGPIVLRRGILRPATSEKNVEILKE